MEDYNAVLNLDQLSQPSQNDQQYDQDKVTEAKENLIQCINVGNAKIYLGKYYTIEDINNMSDEQILQLSERYNAKLAGLMVKSLGQSAIKTYSYAVCTYLGIVGTEDSLAEDLSYDPFLNKATQNFACKIYHKFGALLAPVSVSMITANHYYKNKDKVQQVQNIPQVQHVQQNNFNNVNSNLNVVDNTENNTENNL